MVVVSKSHQAQFWASLVAQMVKSPPAMRDNWVRPLDWEDPLERGRGDQPSLGSQRKRCSSVARCVSLRMSVCVMNTDTCMYACVYVCMGVYLYL